VGGGRSEAPRKTPTAPWERLLAGRAAEAWAFDVVALDELSGGHALSLLLSHLLRTHGLAEALELEPSAMHSFLAGVDRDYGGNPYHCRAHGADVLHGTYLFLTEFGFWSALSAADQFTALFAATMHDFLHPGTTNAHECRVGSERALVYNDANVLESHHAASTFARLLQPGHNFVGGWARESFVAFRKLTIQLVLMTDLAKHFDFVSQLKAEPEGALEPAAGPDTNKARARPAARPARPPPCMRHAPPTPPHAPPCMGRRCSSRRSSSATSATASSRGRCTRSGPTGVRRPLPRRPPAPRSYAVYVEARCICCLC
jgi:hypothetical protein